MHEHDAHTAAENFRDLLKRLGAPPDRIRRARRDLTAAIERYDKLATRIEEQTELQNRQGTADISLIDEANHYRRWQAIAEAKLVVLDDIATTDWDRHVEPGRFRPSGDHRAPDGDPPVGRKRNRHIDASTMLFGLVLPLRPPPSDAACTQPGFAVALLA